MLATGGNNMNDKEKNDEVESINLGRRIGSRYFFVCAGGNRDVLMKMHAQLNIPGSVLKKLLQNPLDETPDIERWLWEGPKKYCKSEYPVDEIGEFIDENFEMIGEMGEYCNLVSLNVVLCWKFVDNQVHGFYVSSDLMRKLSAAGFGFDIDIASWN